MDLYTLAIEYYNSVSDYENQQYFQSKLHNLLNKYEIKQLVDERTINSNRDDPKSRGKLYQKYSIKS